MRKLPTYLPGGALLLTLLLAAVVAALTGGLLLLLQYHRHYAAQTMRHERLSRNLSSATNLLLAGRAGASADSLALNLFDGEQDSVLLFQRAWGVFDIASALAYEGPDTLRHTFLMGKPMTTPDRFALFLADEHRPLSVSGHTRIQGDAFLPEAGVRKSYIENEAYAYEEVVHGGRMLVSTAALPAPSGALIKQLNDYLQPADSAEWPLDAIDWRPGQQNPIVRHFTDHRLVIHSRDSIALRGSLSGHLIVVADSALTIAADARLDNVLLFAPSIRFAPGFQGRLQAFARDSLVVGAGCRFDYPSALGLIHIPTDTLDPEIQPYLRIDSASSVSGLVFTHFPGSDLLLAKLVVAKGTLVHGQVHADGLLELRGTVHGSTSCRRFTLQTPSSLYENFVLGGVMDITKLSRHYVGSPLFLHGRLGDVMLSFVNSDKRRVDHGH